MKKLLLISIVFSMVCATNAQTKYSVPAPTMEEKLNVTKYHLYNIALAQITVAKGEGMTAADLGKKVGEAFIPAWDENGGFEPFVQFILNGWACTAEDVEIIEQSGEELVVLISSIYKSIEDQGVLFGSSLEDFTAYHHAMLNEIAAHYGHSIDMERGEEGYRISIAL